MHDFCSQLVARDATLFQPLMPSLQACITIIIIETYALPLYQAQNMSITTMVVELELLEIRQYNIIPDSPTLFMTSGPCQPALARSNQMLIACLHLYFSPENFSPENGAGSCW